VGTHAEVLNSFASILRPAQNQGVAASRGTKSKLVQRDSLTTSGDNASSCGSSESQSSNRDLGESQEAVVVGDSADNDNSTLLAFLVDVGIDARQRDRRTIDLGHKQAAEHNLVECGVGTTFEIVISLGPMARSIQCNVMYRIAQCVVVGSFWGGSHTSEEAVELHQELEVHVIAGRSLAMCALDMMAVEIDTCKSKSSSAVVPRYAHDGQLKSCLQKTRCGASAAEKAAI
jgi:hypothetical protein